MTTENLSIYPVSKYESLQLPESFIAFNYLSTFQVTRISNFKITKIIA